MAFIYKITNDINAKVYIGKTLGSIEKRWKEHLRACKKSKNEKRPLYAAMRKYDTEHFKIALIEECHKDIVSDREIYWIAYFDSFKNGYNATAGGDGKPYLDYNIVGVFWIFNKNIQEIHQLTGYSNYTIRNALHQFGVDPFYIKKRGMEYAYKPVSMLTKDDKFIRSFSSITEANAYIESIYHCKINGGGHIPCVCSGKRVTAYGYKWVYNQFPLTAPYVEGRKAATV